MIDDERARILHMVARGTVSPTEAGDLLSALDAPGRAEGRWAGALVARAEGDPAAVGGAVVTRSLSQRSLVIRIEGGDSKVNLRLPLGIAKAASHFLPRQAREALSGYGVDLEEFMAGFGNSTEQGTLLEVVDGDEHVLIAVE